MKRLTYPALPALLATLLAVPALAQTQTPATPPKTSHAPVQRVPKIPPVGPRRAIIVPIRNPHAPGMVPAKELPDGLVWELGKRGVERHGQHFSPICAVRQQKSGRVDLRRVDVGRRRAGKEAEGSEDNTLDRGWGWAYERACSRMRQVATTGAQQNKSAG